MPKLTQVVHHQLMKISVAQLQKTNKPDDDSNKLKDPNRRFNANLKSVTKGAKPENP